jgi:protein disulfide-isomerase A1
MQLASVVLFLIFSLLTCASEENNVLVLDDKNFDEELKNHQTILIDFYAPWCGHCKTLEPEYEIAAEILKNNNPPVYLGKVDATVNNELAMKFSIEGFPTIKLWHKGEYKEYAGGRNSRDIVNWVLRKISPPSKLLNSIREVESLKKSKDVVAVYFGETDSASFKVFYKVASNIDEVLFVHVPNQEVANFYGLQMDQVILFKNFDEGKIIFTGTINDNSLTEFINLNSVPLVSSINENVIETIFGKFKSAIFLVRSFLNHSLDNVFKNIASKYKGKLIFVTSGFTGEWEERVMEYFGIKESNLPHVRICEVTGDEDVKFYVHTGEINEENIDNFIADFLEGKLTPYLKSEEIPTQQNEDVFHLVGKQFNEIVLDNPKNVLVEFYAPWCQHCQQLAPIYEKVAEHFKGDLNILIAKIDGTANDVPNVTLEGYPAIKLYSANDKFNPIDFTGEREFNDIVRFINYQLYPEKYTHSSSISGDAQVSIETNESSNDKKTEL